MKDIKKSFGSKVRYYRKKQDLTQWTLADKANLHYTYIGAIERGEKNITLENIFKIANALNVSIVELLDFSQPVSEKKKPDELMKSKIYKILKNKTEKEMDKIYKILKNILTLQKK